MSPDPVGQSSPHPAGSAANRAHAAEAPSGRPGASAQHLLGEWRLRRDAAEGDWPLGGLRDRGAARAASARGSDSTSWGRFPRPPDLEGDDGAANLEVRAPTRDDGDDLWPRHRRLDGFRGRVFGWPYLIVAHALRMPRWRLCEPVAPETPGTIGDWAVNALARPASRGRRGRPGCVPVTAVRGSS